MFVGITLYFQTKLLASFTTKKLLQTNCFLLISDGNECYFGSKMFFLVTASYQTIITDKIFFSNKASSIIVFVTKQSRALIPILSKTLIKTHTTL